jgi:hypothetical protein
MSRLVLLLLTWTLLGACWGIPDPVGKPIHEGPLGFSGLYEEVWDLGGMRLTHMTQILEQRDGEFILNVAPLFYILDGKWWVDQGDVPGDCQYVVRYK